MKKKVFKTIPFNIKLAKKITNKETSGNKRLERDTNNLF